MRLTSRVNFAQQGEMASICGAKTQAEGRVNERIQKDIEESMSIYSKVHEEYLQSLRRD